MTVTDSLEPIENGFRGTVDGVAVQIVRVLRERNGVEESWLVIDSTLSPALDLGLHVEPHGDSGVMRRPVTRVPDIGPDILLGHQRFDASIRVRGDEPKRVRALFASKHLRPAIREAEELGSFVFDDLGFHIEEREDLISDEWTERALRHAVAIVRNATDFLSVVPIASALVAHREPWREYAEAMGLTLVDVPLSMSGRASSGTLRVTGMRRRSLVYGLLLEVEFDPPLGFELAVRPVGSPFEAAWLALTGGDLSLGEPEFDSKFVVRASSESACARVLDPDVRRRLVELGDLRLDDRRLEQDVALMSDDPAEVLDLVSRFSGVAGRIAANAAALRRPGGSAYR